MSKRTTGLRVELIDDTPYGDAPNVTRFRAGLTNRGYLPIVIGECQTVSDAMEAQTTVEDGLQRWDAIRGSWVMVVDRSTCEIIPTGTNKADFSSKLLWPTQRVYSPPFFPSGPVFRSGDYVRFVVFPRGKVSESPPIPSPSFVVR